MESEPTMGTQLTEIEVKLVAKTMALEILTVGIAARLYRVLNALGAKVDVEAERDALRHEYSKIALPGMNPALSDALSGEFATALDDLLDDVARRLRGED